MLYITNMSTFGQLEADFNTVHSSLTRTNIQSSKLMAAAPDVTKWSPIQVFLWPNDANFIVKMGTGVAKLAGLLAKNCESYKSFAKYNNWIYFWNKLYSNVNP